MGLSRWLVPLVALAACSSSAVQFSPSDLVRVSCSSNDGGKTCFGYGEVYPDGRSDACGRIPGGPEFALQMTYRIDGNTLCETVAKSSDEKITPVGQVICAVYVERAPNAFAYRFTDDAADKKRLSYDAGRSDKWCQHLIDAL